MQVISIARDRDKKRKKKRKHPQRLMQRRKLKQILKRRRKRRRDCTLGMPFVIAFAGDPAQLFYCNDIPDTFELIPRTWRFHDQFQRLRKYIDHHVVSIGKKVLIYKAA